MGRLLFAFDVVRASGETWEGALPSADKFVEGFNLFFLHNKHLLEIFELGIDMKDEDKVKNALDSALRDSYDKLEENSPLPGLDGYHVGYVTFNGNDLPTATDADSHGGLYDDDQRGFAEFLEDKIPDMDVRRKVALVCSGSQGIINTINKAWSGMPEDDANEESALPMTGTTIYQANNSQRLKVSQRLNDPRDNHDISIGEDGSVTIKTTCYSCVELRSLVDKTYGIYVNSINSLDGETPVITGAKYTVVVTIKPNVDDFEVSNVTQEML